MKPRVAALILFAALITIGTAFVLLGSPPHPFPISAPVAVFSADRAMAHEFAFAHEPHPLASAAHDRARDYIVSQITALGLNAEIQRTTGITLLYEVAGRIENILTRIPGSAGARDAVLLAAHYDSVPSAPGAGDDGAGVSALLETLRALRAGPPLQNDVICLFTDGEEVGLLGASAFVAEHPWARDVRLSLNFEARGNSGQVQTLLETSSGNGAVAAALAGAYPRAQGSSLGYEVYKRMPNDTDMTIFKRAGKGGPNFAFIGHVEAYHSPLDNPLTLNRGSLQQLGEIALALTRKFGDSDLRKLNAPDAVFFSLPIGVFVHYAGWWRWPILALVLFAWVTSARRVLRCGSATLFSVLLGALALFVTTVAISAVGFGFVEGIERLHGSLLPSGPVYESAFYFGALIVLIFALWVLLILFLRRWLSPDSLILSSGLLLLIASVAFAWWLPGASFVTAWPALALALAPFLIQDGSAEKIPLRRVILILLISIPALLIFVSMIGSFFEALGLTVAGGSATGLTLALFLVSLAPAIEEVRRTWLTQLLTISAVSALLLFLVGAAVTRYSFVHPMPSSMLYALDSDRKLALWANDAAQADTWSSQYVGSRPVQGKLSSFAPWDSSSYLQGPAPILSLRPPEIALLRETRDAGVRTLHLRVTSPRGAPEIVLSAPLDRIASVQVDGKPYGDTREARRKPHEWVLHYCNLPSEGMALQLTLQSTGPLQLTVIDLSRGLPSLSGTAPFPRPPDQVQRHSGDQTLVRRDVVF